MATLLSRGTLGLLLLSATLSACDGSSDPSDISVTVTVDGTGTGTVESQIGVHINCKVADGVTSGTCSDAFQDTQGGVIELEAKPDLATNFSWGGDCRTAQEPQCELAYSSGNAADFQVVGHFSGKTVQVAVSPNLVLITTADQEVVARAQALDKNGAEVLGLKYKWETSDAGVVTVAPTTDTRQAALTVVANGSAIVSATTQGFTGKTQVDINIQN
jgi:hypothetical protein